MSCPSNASDGFAQSATLDANFNGTSQRNARFAAQTPFGARVCGSFPADVAAVHRDAGQLFP
jgi:hypothetical protein